MPTFRDPPRLPRRLSFGELKSNGRHGQGRSSVHASVWAVLSKHAYSTKLMRGGRLMISRDLADMGIGIMTPLQLVLCDHLKVHGERGYLRFAVSTQRLQPSRSRGQSSCSHHSPETIPQPYVTPPRADSLQGAARHLRDGGARAAHATSQSPQHASLAPSHGSGDRACLRGDGPARKQAKSSQVKSSQGQVKCRF